VAAYNRHGPSALETPGRGQRQRAYLSLEQERAVVEQFRKQSEPDGQGNLTLNATNQTCTATPGPRGLIAGSTSIDIHGPMIRVPLRQIGASGPVSNVFGLAGNNLFACTYPLPWRSR
jgi:hypothetical protein